MTTTRRTFLTAVGCTGLLGLGVAQTNGQSEDDLARDSFTLMSGTADATEVHVTTASESGPTALVVGGMHGNENAGYLAAEKIAQWNIERGTLVTIPRANAEAVAADARTASGESDLNRQFPSGSERETELARAIWGVVEEYDPDVVIDLHESIGIYDGDLVGGVGQVIFTSWDESASDDAAAAAQYLNRNYVSRDDYAFSVGAFSSPSNEPSGLFSHKAARDAGADAFLVEVTSKDTEIGKRVQWHTKLVQQLVEEELLTTGGDGNDGDEDGEDDESGGDDEDGGNGDEGDDGSDEQNEPPVAQIQSDAGGRSIERGETVTLDASASEDGDGEIVEYAWDTDGDGAFETDGESTELAPTECGEFRVTLRVTDDAGSVATDNVVISVV
ncbi:PKD domain-containing protein [Haladaptatus litoreus]|uniref:PKD domain-containing protein n=1 Tax=Haladaptatus litoreus TaxID=553468 RepID=A0A1N6W1R6_9EURY|nr:PKD domain-containing protein [Haladaptatus litoreus]SIQ83932.1 PKD domain-containing protein [Haladaptatus litoreus]